MADEKNNNGNSNIFRQKSLDRASSPENLDRYIKTTTPSLWLLLASIIVFLVGIIVWASFGKIYTSSNVGCEVKNGIISCYIKEDDYSKIISSSYIEINDEKIEIDEISGPLKANDKASTLLHNSDIEDGTWYYLVKGKIKLSDGQYKAKVIYEEMNPIVFVIN